MKKPVKQTVWLWVLAVLLAGCGPVTPLPTTAGEPRTEATAEAALPEGWEQVTLLRVVDGDTIQVDREGEACKVRLIGVDTPESVHADQSKNTPAGEAASAYTKEQLPEGMTLYLEKDVSDTDKYGRLLRFVWTEIPADAADEQEICEKMFNARLLGEGYATTYMKGSDKRHRELFLQLELLASREGAGLWAENGLPTDNLETAERLESTQREMAGDYAFVGNKKSKKYHSPSCSGLPGEDNRVFFKTEEEARENGYSPCGKCLPQ